MNHDDRSHATLWLLAGLALGAYLVGIGLARFAYSPLIPALAPTSGMVECGSKAL